MPNLFYVRSYDILTSVLKQRKLSEIDDLTSECLCCICQAHGPSIFDAYEIVKKALKTEHKALTWFRTRNPMLGDLSPIHLITVRDKEGVKRLLDFLKDEYDEFH